MLGFSKEQHVLTLIDEAIGHISALSEQSNSEIKSVLVKTRQVLQGSGVAQRSVPLVLASVRGRVKDVEKYTVARILHDNRVDGHVMSILVRVRLICAEVIRILDMALDNFRLSRAR